jgi:PAS domain S-box-containing protein
VNAELKSNEERFRLLVETVEDYAIYMLDPNGVILTWNMGAERIKGYRAEEIIGQHFSKFFTEEAIRDDYPSYQLKIAAKEGRFKREDWRIRKDGTRFWANVILTALYDHADNLIGFTKITRDLTREKHAEEAFQASERQAREFAATLQAQSTQLQATNKELEAFSYSVSHDLRAPLRGIDGFCQVLMEEYNDQLDDQGQHYLSRVRHGSQQMGKLIDDMLRLSRVTRDEMTIDSVDLSVMALDILRELKAQEPDRQAELIIAPSITVQGDQHLLHAALQNLLDNAWKYTSKHITARIEFGVTERNGQPAYFIKDDGAGFDMQYAGKLFGAFQRLHRVSDFEGSGVGLATVARIIRRHGGEIWAEAALEEGATFYFTLSTNMNIAGKEK